MRIPHCLLAAAAAAGLSVPEASAAGVSWTKDVFPVLQKQCLGCHSDLVQKGGLNLEKRDAVMKGGSKKGASVIPGKPAESPLAYLLDGKHEPVMPPKGKRVSAENIEMINRWIAEGAKFDGEGSLEVEKPNWITLSDTVGPVFAAALSADGKRLAVGRANKVEVWEVDTGKRLALLTGARDLVQSLAFSPDGSLLAVGEFEQVALFGTGDWKPVRTLDGHVERVTAAAFTKDGKTLVTASGMPVKSGFVHVWSVADGKEVRRVEAHTDLIYGLALDAEGKKVATASADKLAKITDIATGEMLKTFAGHTHHVLGVGFSDNGKVLATAGADNDVKVWDIEKGEKLKDGKGHGKQVTALVARADGKSFYTASGDRSIREWKPNGSAVKTLGSLADWVYTLSLSADASRLAVGGQDGTVRVYNTGDGKVLREITAATPAEPPAPPPMPEPKKKGK
jgi:WD40 repeat protein